MTKEQRIKLLKENEWEWLEIALKNGLTFSDIFEKL